MNCKIIHIVNSTPCKQRIFTAKSAILTRYSIEIGRANSLSESTDGPTGRPADNPPNSHGLKDLHCTVTKLLVQVH